MGAGSCRLQDGGQSVLHEHVHQYHFTGAHQLGQIPEVKREKQSSEKRDDAVGAQNAVELGGVRGSVGPVARGAGAHDCHGRGPRARQPMLPVQAAKQQSQREGLLQRCTGAAVLARLHHAGGLLREDRFAAAEGVTG